MRERCQNLKASLQHRASVTPVELAAYWPGGSGNPDTRGRGPWLYCYASYARLMGRAEAMAATETTQDDLLRALAADPVRVELADGSELFCYPKSYLALRWMAHVDALLGAMLFQMEKIPYLDSAAQEDLREEALQGSTELQLALVWAAVYPGVGLPFDERQRLPAIPDIIRALTPLALYQIVRAYREANLQGLAALPALTDGASDGQRPTFAMFLAGLAQEHGLPADVLMRERPLVQLLAQARLSAAAREPAKAGV